MFQNVFATVLLCSCVASGTRLQDSNSVPSCNTNNINYVSNDRTLKPREINDVYANAFNGAYCISENVDLSSLHLNGSNYLQYDFVDFGAIYVGTLVGNNTRFYQTVSYFSFTYDEEYGRVDIYFRATDDDPLYNLYYLENLTYSQQSNGVKQFYLFFTNPYYCNDADIVSLFNLLFTKSGNSYNTVYTGWYTFNTNINISSYYNFLFGYYLADNTIYNTFTWSQNWDSGVQYPYIAFSNDFLNTYYLYQNGTFNGSRAVYFTGVMIPSFIYSELNDYGVFNYVIEPQQYTFGEMIFSVMDAPIYMLSQLFSFELFGLQFYVAFMSIVTVLLICFVIRKIV